MQILSVREQVAAMRSTWPDMKLFMDAPWGAGWTGPLTPFDRTYEVQVTFYLGLRLGECDLRNWGPQVRVLRPDLRREWGDRPPPHLYQSPSSPFLCLFDPASDDWDFDMLVASTALPWAAQWLGFYELWRATGRWTGPERHPDANKGPIPTAAANITRFRTSASPPLDERLTSRVAKAQGMHASSPILRAAAVGRLPSLALDWLCTPECPVPPLEGTIMRMAA